MKERAYPVYTVSKHAEGLAGGAATPGCTKTTSSTPRTPNPKTAPWPMWSAPRGRTWAPGFVSLHSKIRVRLISRNANDTFDTAFWRRRVEYAWAYRKTVMAPRT